jgi:hypothetical protein
MAYIRDYFLHWLNHHLLSNIAFNIAQEMMIQPAGKELESRSLEVSKEVYYPNMARMR